MKAEQVSTRSFKARGLPRSLQKITFVTLIDKCKKRKILWTAWSVKCCLRVCNGSEAFFYAQIGLWNNISTRCSGFTYADYVRICAAAVMFAFWYSRSDRCKTTAACTMSYGESDLQEKVSNQAIGMYVKLNYLQQEMYYFMAANSVPLKWRNTIGNITAAFYC